MITVIGRMEIDTIDLQMYRDIARHAVIVVEGVLMVRC